MSNLNPSITPGQAGGPIVVHSKKPDPKQTDPPALAAALQALDEGLWPVAIHSIDSKVGSPGKAPIGQNWGVERPTPEGLRATWKRYPRAGVGLKLGVEGHVIDIDIDDAEAAAQTLARMFPDGIPKTRGWRNAEDRFHLLLRYHERFARYGKAIIKGQTKDGKVIGNPHYLGLEIRIGSTDLGGKQYQTVIPPSLLANGTARRWNEHREILPPPESLFADLDAYALAKGTAASTPGTSFDLAEEIKRKQSQEPAPARNGDSHRSNRLDPKERALRYVLTMDESIEGADGHGRLFNVACRLIDGFGLTKDEALPIFRAWNQAKARPPESESQLEHKLDDAIKTYPVPSLKQLNASRDRPGRNGAGLRIVSAEPPGADLLAKAEPDSIQPNEAPDDPSLLARLYLDEHCRHPDGLTLRHWQGAYVEWSGEAYRPILVEDVRARIHPIIKAEFDRLNLAEIAGWQRDQGADVGGGYDTGKKGPPKVRKVTTGLLSNVVLAVNGYSHLEPRTPQPSWLMGPEPFPAEDVLPTRNALVYLPGLVARRTDATHPPTPRYFCPYVLDYDFDPAAPRPDRWLAFLDSIWPGDPESIATLQEWFGHLLTPDTTHQKILMMIGPKRSGKGTIARVIKGMLGPDNVANPTFTGLAGPFGLAPLIGKPAAIISDARLSGRTDIAQLVENLLSISGEDAKEVHRKHLTAVTMKLPTRFAIISNELPRLTDASGALAGRLILLRITKSFYGEEDRNLTADLLTELPGILLWAIEGWKRLRDRGRFVQPESAKAMVEEIEDLASPVGAFLKDRAEIKVGAEVRAATLYQAWKEWCQEHGRDNPGDELVFGRNLRAVLPNLTTPYRRLSDGTRKRFYEGIRLLD